MLNFLQIIRFQTLSELDSGEPGPAARLLFFLARLYGHIGNGITPFSYSCVQDAWELSNTSIPWLIKIVIHLWIVNWKQSPNKEKIQKALISLLNSRAIQMKQERKKWPKTKFRWSSLETHREELCSFNNPQIKGKCMIQSSGHRVRSCCMTSFWTAECCWPKAAIAEVKSVCKT